MSRLKQRRPVTTLKLGDKQAKATARKIYDYNGNMKGVAHDLGIPLTCVYRIFKKHLKWMVVWQ